MVIFKTLKSYWNMLGPKQKKAMYVVIPTVGSFIVKKMKDKKEKKKKYAECHRPPADYDLSNK